MMQSLRAFLTAMKNNPRKLAKTMTTVPDVCNGFQFAQDFKALPRAKSDLSCAPRNVIWEYFQNYKEGPGLT